MGTLANVKEQVVAEDIQTKRHDEEDIVKHTWNQVTLDPYA